jgi:hypothetical protein
MPQLGSSCYICFNRRLKKEMFMRCLTSLCSLRVGTIEQLFIPTNLCFKLKQRFCYLQSWIKYYQHGWSLFSHTWLWILGWQVTFLCCILLINLIPRNWEVVGIVDEHEYMCIDGLNGLYLSYIFLMLNFMFVQVVNAGPHPLEFDCLIGKKMLFVVDRSMK